VHGQGEEVGLMILAVERVQHSEPAVCALTVPSVRVISNLVFITETATIAVLLLLILSSTLLTTSILLHVRDRSTDTEGITAPRCTFQPFRFPADNHMLPGTHM
jgi:hypothetical protein